MTTIKVNLTAVGNACEQDATPAGKWPGPGWYVFLADCHGRIFEHAGKRYGPYPVDHGYAEIKDVPHGRYLVYAIVNPFLVKKDADKFFLYQSNFVTHFAVVDVCCGDRCHDICVTLYNSGWHYCLKVIIHWMNIVQASKDGDEGDAKPVVFSLTKAIKSSKMKAMPTDEELISGLDEHVSEFLKASKKGEKG
jgi:hypothetical protein